MKTHSVTLDGKVCSLKYGIDERELVEAFFPRPDGTPGSMGALVREHLIGSGSFKVQATLVWVGVKHLGKAWTLERVRAALDAAMKKEGVSTVLRPVTAAILASACLGKAVEDEPEPAETEGGEGKDQTPTAT